MKTFVWRPTQGRNFGDELGPLIVERLTGAKPNLETSTSWFLRDKPNQRLMTVGSVIEWCLAGNVVWGSGIRSFQWPGHKIDVRGVRGPLTRLYLQDKNIHVPEVFGDPALLLPKLFPEIVKTDEIPLTTVRHLDDKQVGTIKATDHPLHVMQTIRNSLFVESSSLHGLILADAWGIPCRWLPTPEPEIKFMDYFMSTGRLDVKPGDTLPPAKLPDLDVLLSTFPHELFNCKLC